MALLPPSSVEHELTDLARIFRERSTRETPLSYMEYLSLSKRIRMLSLPRPHQPSWSEPTAPSSARTLKEENFISFSNAAKEALRILEEIKSKPQSSSKKRKTFASPSPSFICPFIPEDEIADILATSGSSTSKYSSRLSFAPKQQSSSVARPWWSSVWNVYDTLYSVTKKPKQSPVNGKELVPRDFPVPSMGQFLSDTTHKDTPNNTIATSINTHANNGSSVTGSHALANANLSMGVAIPSSETSVILTSSIPKTHTERTPKVTFSLPEAQSSSSSTPNIILGPSSSTLTPSTTPSWMSTSVLPISTSAPFSFSFPPSSHEKETAASKASSIEIKEIVEEEEESENEKKQEPQLSSTITANQPVSLTSSTPSMPFAPLSKTSSLTSTTPLVPPPNITNKGFSFPLPSSIHETSGELTKTTPVQNTEMTSLFGNSTHQPSSSTNTLTFGSSTALPFGNLSGIKSDGLAFGTGPSSSPFSSLFPLTNAVTYVEGSKTEPQNFSFGKPGAAFSGSSPQPFVFGASNTAAMTNVSPSLQGSSTDSSTGIAPPTSSTTGGFSSPTFINTGEASGSLVTSAGSPQTRFIIPAHKLKRRR